LIPQALFVNVLPVFDGFLLTHGLSWVHAERLNHILLPMNEAHKEAVASVREQTWAFIDNSRLINKPLALRT
jgi:hypothetical protein